MLLTDVPDVVGVRERSPFGTSDHSVIFKNVVLEQTITHEVYAGGLSQELCGLGVIERICERSQLEWNH